MSPETIHSLKSELDDFILQTRGQLSELAQSLKACPAVGRTDAAATIQAADASDEPSAVAQANAPVEVRPLEQDADPIARLKAIKLRLAKQIENH